MGDLISREFMKSIGGTCIAQRLKNGDLCPIISIDLLPSAEPERKKGKWIDSRDVCWLCSECGKWLDVLQGDVDMNFCPNCGADMRQPEEESE